ncbi:sodium/proton antiporter (NhaD family) [Thiogranum longum]|uniref:Sodium/proton antiporter (NhaD family) n=1 Tax=Thiogranum longum TaxID=1537524 RepID=A0A4R1H806_9GAMM|nr:sodium:proton antiporter NhaD [Thiogranum longum]TCK17967.1 sodium/proton antiporter (NhaD family) [Thiogranum longum]
MPAGFTLPLTVLVRTCGLVLLTGLFLYSPHTLAATPNQTALDLTSQPVGYISLVLFSLAYLLVMCEEFTQLRKSKPVILAAGIIWALVAWEYSRNGMPLAASEALRHTLLEFAELFLFLLAAMTYVNAMSERQIFEALRSWLARMHCSYRLLFWITGVIAFFLSPVIDNLTTALVMCAVVLAVGKDNTKFISLACTNIVVAANAGGAFSPFGDITTLMVWQKGLVEFDNFLLLFIPSAVNFLIPALCMHAFIPDETPHSDGARISIRRGGIIIVFLFAATIVTAISFHNYLNLPPMLGMMTGLAYLQFFSYYLKRTHHNHTRNSSNFGAVGDVLPIAHKDKPFDIYRRLARAEWDTLLFFYGVVLCVGGLGFIGYLGHFAELMYGQLGATTANILVGMLSAVIDNIPVMFAVLSMNPDMPLGEWLLVTLTTGVGGSLLSIGSAAGVALMGQARGRYTFFTHLKWTPVIALGYAASIATHLWLNASTW